MFRNSVHLVLAFFALQTTPLRSEVLLTPEEKAQAKELAGPEGLTGISLDLLARAYKEFWVPQSNKGVFVQTVLGTTSGVAGTVVATDSELKHQVWSKPRRAIPAGTGIATVGTTSLALIVRGIEKNREFDRKAAEKQEQLKQRTEGFKNSPVYKDIERAIGKARASRLAYDLVAEWDLEALVKEYLNAGERDQALAILKKGREELDKTISINIPNPDQRKIVVDAIVSQELTEKLHGDVQWDAAIETQMEPADVVETRKHAVSQLQNQNLLFLDSHMEKARDEILGGNIERNKKGVGRDRPIAEDTGEE